MYTKLRFLVLFLRNSRKCCYWPVLVVLSMLDHPRHHMRHCGHAETCNRPSGATDAAPEVARAACSTSQGGEGGEMNCLGSQNQSKAWIFQGFRQFPYVFSHIRWNVWYCTRLTNTRRGVRCKLPKHILSGDRLRTRTHVLDNLESNRNRFGDS